MMALPVIQILTIFFILESTKQIRCLQETTIQPVKRFDSVIYLPEHATVRYQRPDHFRSSATILFWSKLYGRRNHWFWWYNKETIKETCPGLPCDFILDKSRLNQSDAIVFNVYGKDFKLDLEENADQLPPYRLPHQRWIFYSTEPPTLNQGHAKMMSNINGLFNWTMTYRRDADIYAHFGKLILNRNRTVALDRDYSIGKTSMAVWFVSHCTTQGHREDYVKELQQYIRVDVYGGCGPLKCSPPRSKKCYEDAAKKYKFYLSFENTLCHDYVTEKFTKILGEDIVPVVFGGGDYSLYAPPGSYIDALKFESPKALAEHLVYLSSNPIEYNRYFDWKRGYDVTWKRMELYICELCLNLLNPNLPSKTYHDMNDWWNNKGACKAWERSPKNITV